MTWAKIALPLPGRGPVINGGRVTGPRRGWRCAPRGARPGPWRVFLPSGVEAGMNTVVHAGQRTLLSQYWSGTFRG